MGGCFSKIDFSLSMAGAKYSRYRLSNNGIGSLLTETNKHQARQVRPEKQEKRFGVRLLSFIVRVIIAF